MQRKFETQKVIYTMKVEKGGITVWKMIPMYFIASTEIQTWTSLS